MIKENKILKWLRDRQQNSNSWIIVLFTKPSLYLYNLAKRTIFMGLFLLVFYFIFKHIGLKEQSIPSTLHGLIGIVIGLLLVFRTNTAYDRWWEARKIFASLHATFLYLRIKSDLALKREEIVARLKEINVAIFDYVSTKNIIKSSRFKSQFMHSYCELTNLIFQEQFQPPIYGSIERKLADLIDQFSSLERIKDTPIPISYSLHIKLSVFAYLLTLPFGLFFGLGVWSIPLVMILYFIIAGIDIISSEIENPYRGDPNDLPIDEFELENIKYIDGNGRR